MPNERGLKFRTAMSSTIRTELWEEIKKVSEDSDIPTSRLLDRAIREFLEKYRDNPFWE